MVERTKDQVLAGLRSHIARLEGGPGQIQVGSAAALDSGAAAASVAREAPEAAVGLGVAEIDRRLPGHGLQLGRLHEVVGSVEGAGTGFVVHLLRRLMALDRQGARRGPVFWCAPRDSLYAPGLACRGLDVDRFVMVVAPRREDRLWAMEESLRCPGVLAVVGELQGRETVDLTASRRLQLAAGQGGAMALLLRPFATAGPRRDADRTVTAAESESEGVVAGASAAVTRWSVRALPVADPQRQADGDDDMGRRSRWRLQLTRSRTGARHGWTVEVDHATGDFALAPALRDRSGATAGHERVA